jgi:hypothetical protein
MPLSPSRCCVSHNESTAIRARSVVTLRGARSDTTRRARARAAADCGRDEKF